jgi:hypothetical protein
LFVLVVRGTGGGAAAVTVIGAPARQLAMGVRRRAGSRCTSGRLLVMEIVVYEKLGLRALGRAWLNTDRPGPGPFVIATRRGSAKDRDKARGGSPMR